MCFESHGPRVRQSVQPREPVRTQKPASVRGGQGLSVQLWPPLGSGCSSERISGGQGLLCVDGAQVSKMLTALGAAVGRDMVTGGQKERQPHEGRWAEPGVMLGRLVCEDLLN